VSSLGGSVGAGGKNNPDDVKAVQAALKIDPDGKCGTGTINAIKDFQKSLGHKNPDGRIDVGGPTAKALAGRAPAPAPAAAPDAPPAPAPDAPPVPPEDEGFLDGLKKKLASAAGAVTDLPGKVIKGVTELPGKVLDGAKGLGGGGGNPAVASDFGIKVPKLSLDHLSKEQIEAAQRFLRDHLTVEWGQFGSPVDPETYLVKLKGKNATVDEIVKALKAEIPSRVLQNLAADIPTAELRDLVPPRIRELRAPLLAAAIKAADESKKLRPDGSVDPNVTREVAEKALTAFLEKVLKAQGGPTLKVTAPVRLAGRALAKGTGPGPTFLEGNGPFPGAPAQLAAAIVRVLPPSIPRANVEALDRIPIRDVSSTQPPNVAAALAAVVKTEVEAIVKLLPKSVQDDVRKAIPDLIAAGVTALVEHGMKDSALQGRLDDTAKKMIKSIVEASIKQNPDGPPMDRQQDSGGSPNAPDRPEPRPPSQPEQPPIKDEEIKKTPPIKLP
jgi:hypothetical protein